MAHAAIHPGARHRSQRVYPLFPRVSRSKTKPDHVRFAASPSWNSSGVKRPIFLYASSRGRDRQPFPNTGEAKGQSGVGAGPTEANPDPASSDPERREAGGYRGLFLYPNPSAPHHSRPQRPRKMGTRGRQPRSDKPVTSRTGCGDRFHIVRLGESLWGIAARRLETRDPLSITRLWRRIYRMNQNVVGADPALIYPGQRLEIPLDCED